MTSNLRPHFRHESLHLLAIHLTSRVDRRVSRLTIVPVMQENRVDRVGTAHHQSIPECRHVVNAWQVDVFAPTNVLGADLSLVDADVALREPRRFENRIAGFRVQPVRVIPVRVHVSHSRDHVVKGPVVHDASESRRCFGGSKVLVQIRWQKNKTTMKNNETMKQ